jgi:hypothetical protein
MGTNTKWLIEDPSQQWTIEDSSQQWTIDDPSWHDEIRKGFAASKAPTKKQGFVDTIKSIFDSERGTVPVMPSVPLAGIPATAFSTDPKAATHAVTQMPRGVVERIPFAGSLAEFTRYANLYRAARAVEHNQASDNDYKLLQDFARELERDKNLEKTWGGQVAEVVSHLPTFAAEFAATGGAYSGAKNIVQKALGKAAAKKLIKYVPSVVGAMAQTAAMPTRIAATGAEKAVEKDVAPRVAGAAAAGGDWKEQLRKAMTDMNDGFAEALLKAYPDTFVEVASERAGGVVEKLMPQRVKALKAAVAKWWKDKGGRPVELLQKIKQKSGWNGVLGEMFEERVAEVMHEANQRSGIEQKIGEDSPAMVKFVTGQGGRAAALKEFVKQLSVEGAAFSMPGTAARAIEYSLNKIRRGESVASEIEQGLNSKHLNLESLNAISLIIAQAPESALSMEDKIRLQRIANRKARAFKPDGPLVSSSKTQPATQTQPPTPTTSQEPAKTIRQQLHVPTQSVIPSPEAAGPSQPLPAMPIPEGKPQPTMTPAAAPVPYEEAIQQPKPAQVPDTFMLGDRVKTTKGKGVIVGVGKGRYDVRIKDVIVTLQAEHVQPLPKPGPPKLDPEKSLENAVINAGGINPEIVRASGLWGEWERIPLARRRRITRKNSKAPIEETAALVASYGYQVDGSNLLYELADDVSAKRGVSRDDYGTPEAQLEEAEALIRRQQRGGMSPSGLRADITDAEIIDAARDAYERLADLKDRYRRGAPTDITALRSKYPAIMEDPAAYDRKHNAFADHPTWEQRYQELVARNKAERKRPSRWYPLSGESDVPGGEKYPTLFWRSPNNVLDRMGGKYAEIAKLITEAARAKKASQLPGHTYGMQHYDDIANDIIKESGIKRGSDEDQMVVDLLDSAFTGLTPEELRRSPAYRGDKEAAIRAAERFRNEIFEPIISHIRGDQELVGIIGKRGYIRGYFPHWWEQLTKKYSQKGAAAIARALMPERFVSRFLKERESNNWLGTVSIYDAVPSYIASTMKTIHDIPAYDKARAIAESLEDGTLKNYAMWYIQNYMGVKASSGGIAEFDADSRMMKLSRKVAQLYYDNLIGLNPITWGVNLMQTISNTIPEVGIMHTLHAVKKLFGSKEARRKFHESGILLDFPGMESGILAEGKIRKLMHGGMAAAEYINRGIAYLAGLEQAKSRGLVGKAAEMHAMDIVDTTQFAYAAEGQSEILSKLPPDMRVFQTFKLKEAEYVRNLIADAWQEQQEGSGSKAARAKLGRYLAINTGLPFLLQLAGVPVGRMFVELWDLFPSMPRTLQLAFQRALPWSRAAWRGLQKDVFGTEYPKGTRIVNPEDIPADLVTGLYDAFGPAANIGKKVARWTGVTK